MRALSECGCGGVGGLMGELQIQAVNVTPLTVC